MKSLIVYYSRSGRNQHLAFDLQKRIHADIEEVVDRADRSGVLGFVKSGLHSIMRSQTSIAPSRKNPANYDIIILISPVWVGLVPPAMRTYVAKHWNRLRKVMFLSVSGSGSQADAGAVGEIEKMIGRRVVTYLMVSEREMECGSHEIRLEQFIKKIGA
jgi:flavodoxin